VRMTREQAALLLGVRSEASSEEVNHAWRVWAKLAHPDAGGDREHFESLAHARSILLRRAEPTAEVSIKPRASLRSVCRRPSVGRLLVVCLAIVGSSVVGIGAAQMSEFGAALAIGVASAATAIAIQRAFLGPLADTGHRITIVVLTWLPVVAALGMCATYLGVELIEFLPVVVLPLVVTVALVNPGAGLWRPVRQTL
jgi:hypothetical protein